jgi:hypothetical protein
MTARPFCKQSAPYPHFLLRFSFIDLLRAAEQLPCTPGYTSCAVQYNRPFRQRDVAQTRLRGQLTATFTHTSTPRLYMETGHGPYASMLGSNPISAGSVCITARMIFEADTFVLEGIEKMNVRCTI